MKAARVLIAGIGNIFFADDAFGVEVARRLAAQPLPSGVTVADFGIRGLHLAFEIVSGYDLVILVDAVSRDGSPGTLYVLEPEAEELSDTPDAHSMELQSVLSFIEQLGVEPPRMLIVGCEPANTDPGIGLSEVMEPAVERAVALVRSLFSESLV
jgi:hydrogenase maturation protease